MKTNHRRWLLLALLCGGCATAPVQEPAVSDPERDTQHPARMDALAIESQGQLMNGIVYVAAGDSPHPTLILLHGFPGNERNLDLAQAIRRVGWNVLFFHYRGAWGSEGDFSFSNALADVAAVVRLATTPEFALAHRSDPRRIALLGHSMGGFMALTVGSEMAQVGCIGSLAGANLGLYGAVLGDEALAVAQRLTAMTRPLKGASGTALLAEVATDPARFELNARAPALVDRPVLLVAGRHDVVALPQRHHEPLLAALTAAGATSLRSRVLDADHAFSSRRLTLASTVIDWLEKDCVF